MLLSDVVKVLGDRTLGEFPWGCVVKDTVNLFAEETLKLKLTSTGPDLTRALDAMTETNRNLLHNAQLDTGRSCLITPVGGGMDVVHGESDPPTVFGHSQFFTGLLVSIVVIVALVMFSNLSINEKTDWKEVAKTGMAFVKSFF